MFVKRKMKNRLKNNQTVLKITLRGQRRGGKNKSYLPAECEVVGAGGWYPPLQK
jgi:hypothetical protein